MHHTIQRKEEGGDLIPKLPTEEYNFASHHPTFLDEWDYERNLKAPNQYTPSSGKSVWWICRTCNHNWKAKIDNRIKPRGCQNCAGKEPHSDGTNSLFALRPELVLDWYDERSPKDFRIGSHYRARWKCHKCEHVWYTQITKRAELDRGCLSCKGQQAHSSGRNSVAVTHPDLVKEWNDPRDPMKFLPGSHTKINWKCSDCSHEWPQSVGVRTRPTGCPVCKGPGGSYSRVVHSDGHNSMRNMAPELAEEFHEELNGPKLSPDNLTPSTNKKLWWQCRAISESPCGFIWPSTAAHRSSEVAARGCPRCAKSGFKYDQPAFLYCLEFEGPLGKFWKVGITDNLDRRIYQIQKSISETKLYHDYKVKLYNSIEFRTGFEARDFESDLLSQKEIRLTIDEKFDGSYELFSSIPQELI